MPSRGLHRVRQFAGALRPRVSDTDREEVARWLDGPERRIFEGMMLRDQQHGIDVFRRVAAAAPAPDRALCAAALLHDCGKGQVALWQRVTHVLLGATAPGIRVRVSSEHGASWRQAFWRLLHHPRIGSEMVAAAGGDAETVRLIREQERADPDPRLALLQSADEA